MSVCLSVCPSVRPSVCLSDLILSYFSVLIYLLLSYLILSYFILYILFYLIPVVPHKAVAEVSKIGNL